MAGHSQFKNIMHRKGRQDAVRARLFTRLQREVLVAARSGLPDPALNPRLRSAIQAAKAANVPKDVIERAIKRAQGGDAASRGSSPSWYKRRSLTGRYRARRGGGGSLDRRPGLR